MLHMIDEQDYLPEDIPFTRDKIEYSARKMGNGSHIKSWQLLPHRRSCGTTPTGSIENVYKRSQMPVVEQTIQSIRLHLTRYRWR